MFSLYMHLFLCVYVMGDTAQDRTHATRPAYDPHFLQRHILEHLVPYTLHFLTRRLTGGARPVHSKGRGTL